MRLERCEWTQCSTGQTSTETDLSKHHAYMIETIIKSKEKNLMIANYQNVLPKGRKSSALLGRRGARELLTCLSPSFGLGWLRLHDPCLLQSPRPHRDPERGPDPGAPHLLCFHL